MPLTHNQILESELCTSFHKNYSSNVLLLRKINIRSIKAIKAVLTTSTTKLSEGKHLLNCCSGKYAYVSITSI